jgi:hypothetical protein
MGLFTETALTLSKYFGRVTYSSPWANGFPSSMQTEVGEGFKQFERIKDVHEVIDETDLFVFTDIYYSALQIDLLARGKRVWGPRDADELEIYRSDAKKHFAELGIPQGAYTVVRGIGKLRETIKHRGKDKLWIKIEETRGDTESFSVQGGPTLSAYDLYKNKIDDLEHRLGPKAEVMIFIVEDDLPDTLDLAIDTHSIDGTWPSVAILGTEEKGECYIGVKKNWSEMPKNLVDIYNKLSDTLKRYEYRNFISLESRVKNKSIYLGDPCMRSGSPPSEVELKWITNIPDIMWFGAEGKMVDPDFDGKFGVQLNVHSDWCDKNPLIIDFPPALRDNITFRYNAEFDGVTCIMPQGAGPRCAAIVSHGDSLDDCIEECKEISKQINGIQIESFTRSFPIIQEKIKTLKSWGEF